MANMAEKPPGHPGWRSLTPDERERLARVGVLMTSHPRQQRWMTAAIRSWDGWPGPVVLGYDDVSVHALPRAGWQPPIDELFATRWPAGRLGGVKGDLWQMRLGSTLLVDMGAEWIFKSAADLTMYRHAGIIEMLDAIEAAGACVGRQGTGTILATVDAFVRVIECYHVRWRTGSTELFWNARERQFGIEPLGFGRDWLEERCLRVHLHGQYANNNGISVADAWEAGELWPRAE